MSETERISLSSSEKLKSQEAVWKMLKSRSALTIVFLFIFLCGIGAANAQIPHESVLRADIPHEFVLEGKRFPAGTYTFARSGVTSPSTQLIMRGNGSTAIFSAIHDRPVDGYAATELQFRNIDGNYFLSKIKLEGEITGYYVPLTKSQRRMMAATVRMRASTRTTETGF